MKRTVKRVAGALCLGLAAWQAMAQPVQADAPSGAPSQVVVEGRLPGPPVWKVSRDGHVLWVLGMIGEVPRDLSWPGTRLEGLVRGAQELLLPPGIRVETGFLRGVVFGPVTRGTERNPDGATLRQVVPADVYARWLPLKEKYLAHHDEVELRRPPFAAKALLTAAMRASGLAPSRVVVGSRLEGIALRNNVKVTFTRLVVATNEPRRSRKHPEEAQADDLACLVKTMDQIESVVGNARARAEAWADGDVAALRGMRYVAFGDVCSDAILNSAAASHAPDLPSLRTRAREQWLQAARTALARNDATVALLGVDNVFSAYGYLAALQAEGYAVEGPP